MNYTYYVVEKIYKGFFSKKFVRNASSIGITDPKTGDGLILFYSGSTKIDGKKLTIFLTLGWEAQSADELVQKFPDENFMLLEKLPSTVKEILNKNIDYCSIKEMKSSTIIKVDFKETGKYFKSKNNTFLYYDRYTDSRGSQYYVFMSDMVLNIEENEFPESVIDMNTKKTAAKIGAFQNAGILNKLKFKTHGWGNIEEK